MTNRERSVTHASFALERTYPHPPARVFRAFAEPEAIRAWLVEGKGWGVESFELDFRAGGLRTSPFRFRGGPEFHNQPVYQDIVADERIVYTYDGLLDERGDWLESNAER